MHKYGSLSLTHSILISGISQVITGICVIIFGYLTDRINNHIILLISCASLIILSPFIYHIILHASFFGTFFLLILLTVPLSMYISPSYLLMLRTLPSSIRYSGFAFAYGIGAMLFGGLTPIIASSLVYATKRPDIIGYMLSVAALISSIALVILHRLPCYDIQEKEATG